MSKQPASPRSKILEEIYVRGEDTIIRISENAVIVKTTREGGIALPKDSNETEKNDGDKDENTINVNENETAHVSDTDQLVTDDDLVKLSGKIEQDWRTLALCHLDIPAIDVDSIIQNSSDLPDQIFCTLRLWKTKLGRDATVKNLISKLEGVIEKNKWEFLIQNEEPNDEQELTDERQDEVNIEDDENKSETQSISSNESDEVLTPDISLFNIELNAELDEALGATANNDQQYTTNEGDTVQKKQGHVLEDIDRLAAVYSGFAEENKEELTSIGTSLGGILQKVLRLDHENKTLKTENTKLKLKKATLVEPSTQRKQRDNKRNNEEREDRQSKMTSDDYKRQRENYLKVKGHLKEAVKANHEWETFSRKQRDEHQIKMRENAEIVRSLGDDLKRAESSSSDVSRQMESILNATETQSSELQKELEKVQSENTDLKKKLQRMTLEKRKVENLSKNLLKEKSRSEKPTGRQGPEQSVDYQPRDSSAHGFCEFEDDYSVQQVIQMAQRQAKPPPNVTDIISRQQKSDMDLVQKYPSQVIEDDVVFLKEQILQYKTDFERERRDRTKAAGQLESLRRELKDTKLILTLQSEEIRGTGGTTKYGPSAARRESKKKGFPYMDPDEMAKHRSKETEFDGVRPHESNYYNRESGYTWGY